MYNLTQYLVIWRMWQRSNGHTNLFPISESVSCRDRNDGKGVKCQKVCRCHMGSLAFTPRTWWPPDSHSHSHSHYLWMGVKATPASAIICRDFRGPTHNIDYINWNAIRQNERDMKSFRSLARQSLCHTQSPCGDSAQIGISLSCLGYQSGFQLEPITGGVNDDDGDGRIMMDNDGDLWWAVEGERVSVIIREKLLLSAHFGALYSRVNLFA